MRGKDLFLWESSPHSAAAPLQESDPSCITLGMKQPQELQFWKLKNRLEIGCNRGIWGSKANPCPQWDRDWFVPAILEKELSAAGLEVAGGAPHLARMAMLASAAIGQAGKCKPRADELRLGQEAWGEPCHRPLCQETCHNPEARKLRRTQELRAADSPALWGFSTLDQSFLPPGTSVGWG